MANSLKLHPASHHTQPSHRERAYQMVHQFVFAFARQRLRAGNLTQTLFPSSLHGRSVQTFGVSRGHATFAAPTRNQRPDKKQYTFQCVVLILKNLNKP